MRQGERLAHTPHQRLENLVGTHGRRDFLKDVEQEVARAQRFLGLARLGARANVHVQARAHFGQIDRPDENVPRTSKQRVGCGVG